jgi:hypothetical protein
MGDVMIAYCTLHNMIVEARKDGYLGTNNAQVKGHGEYLGQVLGVKLITEPEEVRELSLLWMTRFSEKESPIMHKELKEARASAVWEAKGHETE